MLPCCQLSCRDAFRFEEPLICVNPNDLTTNLTRSLGFSKTLFEHTVLGGTQRALVPENG